MTIPETFLDSFERRFGGRFRIRWSDVEKRFLIEQRVARGLAPGMMDLSHAKTLNADSRERKARYQFEDRVRANDGYVLTAVVTPGTRAYCTRCGTQHPSPVFEFAVTNCGFCAMQGVEQKVHTGFFLFNDRLLDEMDRIDPEKDGCDRVLAETKLANQRREIEQMNDFLRPIDARYRDDFRRLVGIPGVGYTGKIFAGSEGAGTR